MKQIEAKMMDSLIDNARLHAMRLGVGNALESVDPETARIAVQLEILQRKVRRLGALSNVPPILYSQIPQNLSESDQKP